MATRVPRLYISNLPWTVGRKELKDYFSQFGFVTSASVIFNKATGLNRGYGFIQFGNKDGHLNATNSNKHVLEGNKIGVQTSQNSNGN